MQQKGVQQLLAEKRTHQEQDHLSRLLCGIEEFCGSSDRSWPRSRDGVESTKVLGRVAILKHSFFAGPHYRAADLRARLWLLLVTLFVNAAAAKLTMKTTSAITNNRK